MTAGQVCPSGASVLWPPEGAGDFADLAWLVAEALGNGAGVKSMQLSSYGDGPHALVFTLDLDYVRDVAESFGWAVEQPDEGYACASGRIGGVRVEVSWVGRTQRASSP